tara:strand:- start:218 stop:808 length:591 start_codon:yes stop_codon:yes gene_type:complete
MKFLFDLGGVFFDWDPKYFYKSIFSDEEMNYFLEKVCSNEWNIKQDAGRLISDAEEEAINLHPKYCKEIRMYYKNHRKMIKGTFKEAIDLLNYLKSKNYFCYVLSNWSAETFVGMKRDYPFLNYFDGIIISGEEKLVKPNKKIFDLAIKRFNLIPNQTLFIDDRFENIRSAEKIGFKIVHLKKPNTINQLVRKFVK